jgi:hypothetical protein
MENAIFAHRWLDSRVSLLVGIMDKGRLAKELGGKRREFAQDPLANLFEGLLVPR